MRTEVILDRFPHIRCNQETTLGFPSTEGARKVWRQEIGHMDRQRWQKIREIFAHISDESPGFRQDYLEMVCAQDADLRIDLERMLEAHDKLDSNSNIDTGESDSVALPERLGEYNIDASLGQGGMSQVFRAHRDNGDQVAIKCLPDRYLSNSRAIARMQREADILAGLNHPGLCRLREVIRFDGAIALVMDYVDGSDLAQILEAGAQPIARALSVTLQLAQILEVAHAQHIIHRDIKPSNVMVSPTGLVTLIDFGVASVVDTRLTMTGEILGSPAYMSPEQWRGEAVDGRADVWGAGALLYHLCGGAPPFAGDTPGELARRILSEPPAPLPATSVDGCDLMPVQALVTRMLQKDPAQRIATIAQVAAEVKALCVSLPG